MMSLLRQCLSRGHVVQQCLYHQTTWAFHQRLCGVQQLHTSTAVMAAAMKNSKKKIVKKVHIKPKSLKMQREVVTIRPNMTVKQLAVAANKTVDEIFECFLYVNRADRYDHPNKAIHNVQVIKDTLDKCGYRWRLELPRVKVDANKDVFPRPPPDPSCLVKRSPVVAIMGHIDHGKTTLLDSLRKSSIVKQEFGGITQHIGAFSVKLESGEAITFLDTPGHAAFHKMRSRGANLTDIVILVVAADDGAMEQTAESIKFAEEAGAAIIVAINKIDRHEADIERTKTSLLQHGIVTEEHGGETQVVPISALKGTNLSDLKEAIITLSEVMDLRGDPTGSVEGTVIESRLHPHKGKLCTMLVERGRLKKGAFLVADRAFGKVKALYDDRGAVIQTAGPGSAVEILGWKELPSPGDFIQEVKSEKHGQEVVQYRSQLEMQHKALSDQKEYDQTMEEHWLKYRAFRESKGISRSKRFNFTKLHHGKEAVERGAGPTLGVVIRGDVDGSVEAILDTLSTYQSDQCSLDILSFGCGAVTEEDVHLAADFKGVVYAFNTSIPSAVRAMAEKLSVQIASHNVIYKLVDDLKDRLQGSLPPLKVEEEIGEAKVVELFMISTGNHKVPVAGCRCVSGSLNKKQFFKLVRNDEVIFDGELDSMRHLKKEVQTIKKEMDCGLQFSDRSVTPEPNDQVICYELKEVKQTLQWNTNF